MLIYFNEIAEKIIAQINDDKGELSAKMYVGEHGKIIPFKNYIGGLICFMQYLTKKK